MPRGARKDKMATKVLFENGLLLDRKSFISLDVPPHLYLKGEDITRARELSFKKNRSRCHIKAQGCEKVGSELDHKQGGLSGRCDCQHNLAPACISCHRKKHVHVKFYDPKVVKALKDFNEVQEEE